MPLECRSTQSRPARLVPSKAGRGAKRPDRIGLVPARPRAAKLWSPDEELAGAKAMAEARVELWRRMLADPKRVAFARAAAELPPDPAVRTGLDGLATPAGNGASRKAAVAALAQVLAEADRDLALAGVLMRASGARPADRAKISAAWASLHAHRRRFAVANLRLVGAMVRRFMGRGMDPDDLVQEGSMGLLRAVDRYDHRMGFRFSTYAVWWVRHAIERAIRNRASLVRIPVPTQEAVFRLNRARAEVARREGRSATDTELSDAGFSAATVRRLDRATSMSSVMSLSAAAFDDEGPRTPVLVDEAEGAEDILSQRELGELARTMLDRLRPREADVLRRRFGLDGVPAQTLAEIGASLQMSRERVRQIQNAALHRLRSMMTRRDPELELPGVDPRERLAS